MHLRLFGTTTSPYVRRVRIVAVELGLPVELVPITTPEGQEKLAEVTPIWKVPTLVIVDEGVTVFDSHAIIDLLMRRSGPGDLRPIAPDDIAARNVVAVIDGALDSLINALYLARDGVDSFHSAYMRKQVDRAENALLWLGARVGDTGFGPGFGLTEIALVAAIDWIRLRSALPLDHHDRLVRAAASWNPRTSVAATRP